MRGPKQKTVRQCMYLAATMDYIIYAETAKDRLKDIYWKGGYSAFVNSSAKGRKGGPRIFLTV